MKAASDTRAQSDGAHAGRGALDGALAVLDALTGAQDGIGPSELARATGLVKPSAYRLAQQLVNLGAAQHVGHHYYVGARLAHIALRREPDPLLRRAAQLPVHDPAVRSPATASRRILHETGCGRSAAPNL